MSPWGTTSVVSVTSYCLAPGTSDENRTYEASRQDSQRQDCLKRIRAHFQPLTEAPALSPNLHGTLLYSPLLLLQFLPSSASVLPLGKILMCSLTGSSLPVVTSSRPGYG